MATTTIKNRQIADGAIDDAKVVAGAAIQTSKLQDGALFIQSGGGVPFAGNQSMGGNKLTNLGTPTGGSNDAARIVDVENAVAALNSLFDGKGSVRAASTANVTVSNPGTAVFDGVTLSSGQRLLLKNQTAQAENGIYVFNGSGVALTRATDFDAWAEIPGGVVPVEEGTTLADTLWLSTANSGGTLGTTAITWFQIPTTASGLTSSNFVDKETPTGLVNGSNTTYTLANTPVAGSEHVYLNGLLQESGSGNDYTISGATITMLSTPLSGEKIRVSYRK
jgi:hypothetical protein